MRARGMLVIVLLMTLAIAGCASPSNIRFIPEGDGYSLTDLAIALEEADPGSTARVSVDDAPAVRQKALADLRREGDDAAALADTLTAEFPTDAAAVPFLVERGMFDGQPAWIVYESWGEQSGPLRYRRLWVLAYDTRTIIAAQSMR